MSRHRVPVLALLVSGLVAATAADMAYGATAIPPGASPRVASDRAISVALARVPQGILVSIERLPRGAWEVEVATPTGQQHDIRVNASGRVVHRDVDDQRRVVAPLPRNAVTAPRAGAIAVAHVGGGVAVEIARSNRRGVAWRVDVYRGQIDHYVDVAADGTVMRTVIDD